MSSLNAELTILEAWQTVLRGFRLSEDSAIAEAAIRRERELEPEIKKLRELAQRQPELGLHQRHQDAA